MLPGLHLPEFGGVPVLPSFAFAASHFCLFPLPPCDSVLKSNSDQYVLLSLHPSPFPGCNSFTGCMAGLSPQAALLPNMSPPHDTGDKQPRAVGGSGSGGLFLTHAPCL